MSTSAIYELIEWGAAEVFGGDLGAAFLGTQGDVWDAHKDMALASLGALLAMLATAALNALAAARLRPGVVRQPAGEGPAAVWRGRDPRLLAAGTGVSNMRFTLYKIFKSN